MGNTSSRHEYLLSSGNPKLPSEVAMRANLSFVNRALLHYQHIYQLWAALHIRLLLGVS